MRTYTLHTVPQSIVIKVEILDKTFDSFFILSLKTLLKIPIFILAFTYQNLKCITETLFKCTHPMNETLKILGTLSTHPLK